MGNLWARQRGTVGDRWTIPRGPLDRARRRATWRVPATTSVGDQGGTAGVPATHQKRASCEPGSNGAAGGRDQRSRWPLRTRSSHAAAGLSWLHSVGTSSLTLSRHTTESAAERQSTLDRPRGGCLRSRAAASSSRLLELDPSGSAAIRCRTGERRSVHDRAGCTGSIDAAAIGLNCQVTPVCPRFRGLMRPRRAQRSYRQSMPQAVAGCGGSATWLLG